MIRVYANPELTEKKQHTVFQVSHGSTKNGKPYTMFLISDSKKLPSGEWENNYYTVYVWKYLSIKDKDKIIIKEMQAFEVSETTTSDGKRFINKTIFADVEVVGVSQPTVMPEIAPFDSVPF